MNDLKSQRPDLADQWHPYKNGNLRPEHVCVFSSRSVWWQVKEKRFGREFILEWKAVIANRSAGAGCPYTSVPPRKLLKGFNDLQATNPDPAQRWHPTKNGALTPDMVFENATARYWWYHKVKRENKEYFHEWRAYPASVKRGGDRCGCPICHGTQVMEGYNDLLTCNPELCREWDYEKNRTYHVTPQTVTPGSNKRVYWLCPECGHSWKAMIENRAVGGTGCPKCRQRTQTSFPEQALYYYLKGVVPLCQSREQSVLLTGEIDIYLPEHRFGIEYCGLFSHQSEKRRNSDRKKREECRQKGIHLIQIFEHETIEGYFPEDQTIYCVVKHDYSHLYFVMQCLCDEMKRAGIITETVKIDLKRDECAIREQYQKTRMENSIARTHPQLVEEWDYERNGRLNPENFSAGSGVNVGWIHTIRAKSGIEYTHRWRAKICQRAAGKGCPVCSGKIVEKGFNDLASVSPSLISEWNDRKNKILPTEVTAYSKRKVWWNHEIRKDGICVIHEWLASPGERMRGNGCGICAGKVIVKGVNDLTATHPHLLSEWDYQKNVVKPESISYGYDKKVWWIHVVKKDGREFVHSWEASPNSRTNSKSGCPYCANKRVLSGYNDLKTCFPEIAEKCDYARNAPAKPDEFTPASSKKMYWTDRERKVRICDRTKYLRNLK